MAFEDLKKEPIKAETPKEPEEDYSDEAITDAITKLLDSGIKGDELLEMVKKAIENGDIPETCLELVEKLCKEDKDDASKIFGIDLDEKKEEEE